MLAQCCDAALSLSQRRINASYLLACTLYMEKNVPEDYLLYRKGFNIQGLGPKYSVPVLVLKYFFK